MKHRYVRTNDFPNYGVLVKIEIDEDDYPKAYKYDTETKKWTRYVDFYHQYFAPEEDNSYDMYDDISEEEVAKFQKDYIGKAHEIAKKAHEGQVDKAGIDYIKHPEFVASIVFTPDAKAAAYLHDVLEDTEVTADDLRKADIPELIVEAVEILTKKEGEDYFEYLAKIKNNPIALEVKRADLEHNMDISRIEKSDEIRLTEKDTERLAKYRKAQEFLQF